MPAQRLGRVVIPGQFRFRQGGMDLAVANVMHQNRRAPLSAFQLVVVRASNQCVVSFPSLESIVAVSTLEDVQTLTPFEQVTVATTP